MIRLVAIMFAWACVATPAIAVVKATHRLPAGYAWGKCVLKVDGKTYISGRCAYSMQRGGSLEINGPHQVYAGIDYPETDMGALAQSRDYFAYVDVEGRSGDGFWNADRLATHAQAHLGTLERRGACWINERAEICLWRR
jgi:hypothetical protein